ncbi:MAG: zinc ribbon domain-containing protein [Lentimicrobiaceae bacterium]|nr:zinc ribbon domain-containing protein [Lentimicrobiaceae bacterium]
MIFCENCGKQLNDGVKFCGGCGSAIGGSTTPICANCGKSLEVGQKFCDGCGTSVGGSSETQHYAPPTPQVFAPIATNTTTIRENRFQSNNGNERNTRIGNSKFNKYDEPSLSKNTPNSNSQTNQMDIGEMGTKVLKKSGSLLWRFVKWFFRYCFNNA